MIIDNYFGGEIGNDIDPGGTTPGNAHVIGKELRSEPEVIPGM